MALWTRWKLLLLDMGIFGFLETKVSDSSLQEKVIKKVVWNFLTLYLNMSLPQHKHNKKLCSMVNSTRLSSKQEIWGQNGLHVIAMWWTVLFALHWELQSVQKASCLRERQTSRLEGNRISCQATLQWRKKNPIWKNSSALLSLFLKNWKVIFFLTAKHTV